MAFAKSLTYPTPVTTFNVKEMRELVLNGPENYPGAVWVEENGGRRFELARMDEGKREALAARLLSGGLEAQCKVGRQLRDGDMVLMVSERSERAFWKTSILAMKCAKLLQTASSTTKLTNPICLARSFRSSFIINAPRFAWRRIANQLSTSPESWRTASASSTRPPSRPSECTTQTATRTMLTMTVMR